MYPPTRGGFRLSLILLLFVLIVVLSVLVVVLVVLVLVLVLILVLVIVLVVLIVLMVVLHNKHSFFIFGNYALIMPRIIPVYACFLFPIAMQDGQAKHTKRKQTQR